MKKEIAAITLSLQKDSLSQEEFDSNVALIRKGMNELGVSTISSISDDKVEPFLKYLKSILA